MITKTIACVGDSITGGYFAQVQANTYPYVLLNYLRARDAATHNWGLLTADVSASWPLVGQCWVAWRDYIAGQNPDVVVFQAGENDVQSAATWGGNPPTALVNAIGAGATTFVVDQNLRAGRAYLITDGTNTEVVIPQTVATVTGTRVIRGAMGTTARDWPAASTVTSWTAAGTGGWATVFEYAIRSFLATTGPKTPVLVGGQWFEAQTGTNGKGNVALSALATKLQAEGYKRVEFCPYEAADGTSLTASGNTVAVKSVYTGPTAFLAANLTNVAGTMTVDDATDIAPGDLLLLTSDAAATAPTAGNSEIVQCASKVDATGVVTFDATTANAGGAQRNKLGSTARAFSTGNRVCKLALGCLNPRAPWLTLGAADFAQLSCQYDTHPNDRGQREVGYAFARGYERAVLRIGEP